ncbi:MAG TPA: 16S rRNA (guanine(966)-N(2))-methyltransferase RsmD [Candidatus Limnocylindrales bacterium]|nr:16S rRNA (guanine(966)-N(2))-methyltransferase RsmD [Candidatus Limnocylindrales bacterium]
MRIVAGKWRGRPLRAPKGLAVRPTSDRVREAIFDILGGGVEGASVLDLFAGSGALGLEAISRGASRGVFVESDPAAFGFLRKNIESLGAGEAEAILLDYRQALRRLGARSMRFDLVFLDPPYGKGLAADAAARLSRAEIVAPGGTVAVEEAVRTPEAAFPEAWELSADRRYGDTRVMLFRVSP